MRRPVCATEVLEPSVETHGRFTMRWCGACDVQFADPMEEAPAEFYDSHPLYGGPESLHASPRLLNWDQRCVLRDHPRPGGALLDVGCGTGQFVEAARTAGYQARGLDLSAVQLEVARRRFRGVELHAGRPHDYAQEVPPGLSVGDVKPLLRRGHSQHGADPRPMRHRHLRGLGGSHT